MKPIWFLLSIAVIGIIGCDSRSTLDRFKDIEARRESRQLKPEQLKEIERLRKENQQLKSSSQIASQQTNTPSIQSSQDASSPRVTTEGVAPTPFPQDPSKAPSKIGVELYKRTYTNSELIDLAAASAEMMIPPLERFDRSRPPQKIFIAQKSAITIEWSSKDQLFWATVPIVYREPRNAPGTPSEPPKWIAYLRQMNSDGFFEWFRYSMVSP